MTMMKAAQAAPRPSRPVLSDGITFNHLVELIERLAIPWHVSQRGNGTTVGTM